MVRNTKPSDAESTNSGVNRRTVLQLLGTGAGASIGLVGTASAHWVVGKPMFCGCNQLCVCVEGNSDLLMARENEEGEFEVGFVVGDDELDPYPKGDPRYSGNFCVSTDDENVPDGKIIGLQVAGTRWVNPNPCAQEALQAEQEQLDSTHQRREGDSGGPCDEPPCKHSSGGNGGGNGDDPEDPEDQEDPEDPEDPDDDGIPMETSCNYSVLAKSGISTVPNSDITGDIGVSPIASTAITGFSLELDTSGQFATSDQVDGTVFAANYNEPTPTELSTAVSDMEAAYTDAAGRNPDFTNVASGQIGGETLTPGVYRWNSDVSISGDDLTLAGGPDDVWIFQITGNLTMAENLSVELNGGAQVKNIFWQVAGGAGVEIGANATFAGIVMTQTGINVLTGATVNGKLLAQTDVNLQMATVSGLGT